MDSPSKNQMIGLDTYHKIINQLHRCYECKHASGHRVYVSQFGNISKDGFFIYYTLPGVDSSYWQEISFEEFSKSARSEALFMIEFIERNKRLPNYTLNSIPPEYRKHL